ncbi:hypothetical protein [Corynebacterium anserum]|uniref:Uncharacterized protein n=1 Tax=Corynebacterium anserum TaxID=2684406 RepID=A0A7G7YQD1_9CORY|nr:hypothetical protein [Corynebacterium anserum]QNH96701.1 hypothetical protein GP473_08615 [Corynebacterium anserum]
MNTVEASMVFTALAATVGILLGGFSTVATRSTVESLARDAARIEALGGDGAAYVRTRSPEARVGKQAVNIAGQQAIEVRVSHKAVMFDVTAHATVIAEPSQ